MTVRVIHAHPVPESYSGAVLDAALDGLRAAGVEPIVTRLGEGAEPGPTAEELAGTTALHFVHPTWWGGQPAVLLDWIQRTLGPWIDGAPAEPSPLAEVGRLTAVTTHGSSSFVNRLQGEPGRQLVMRTIASLCRPDVRADWIALYTMDRTTDGERRAFLDRVRDQLAVTNAPVPR